jgi:major membrane immunogen (membrane-anchored lipoprotein)
LAFGSGNWADGIYFAMEDHFNVRTGWRHTVTLEVRDGRIVSARWNGAHRENGSDKVTRSENGEYGMVANGGAQAPWFEQADAAERWLLEHQDRAEAPADAVSGVSIRVGGFFDLVEKALDQGPVGYGRYRDGVYTATADSFEEGWKNTVSVTVISGYIVAAELDAIPEAGGKNKEESSITGAYGMTAEGEATTPWYEQIAIAEEWLVQNQGPNRGPSDTPDAPDPISGVTVAVEKHFALVEEALSGARR